MNCWDAEQLFDAYLDGELSGTLRLELDAHRLRCARCRKALAMMDACAHVVANDAPPARLSADFTDRLMAVIDARHGAAAPRRLTAWQRFGQRRWLFAGLAQAAAIGLFALLWPGFQPRGASTTINRGPMLVDPRSPGRPIDIASTVANMNSHFSAAEATLASDAGGWLNAIMSSFSMHTDVNEMLASNPLASLLIGLPPQTDWAAPVASDEGSL